MAEASGGCLGALFPERPHDRVEDIRLPTAIRPDNDRNARLKGDFRREGKGLKALGIEITPKKEDNSFILGSSPVLDDQGKKAIQELLDKIRAALDSKAISFDLMEEIVIDLKTVEVQMLSPKPKTSIIREVFKFINQNLKDLVPQDLQLELQTIISINE